MALVIPWSMPSPLTNAFVPVTLSMYPLGQPKVTVFSSIEENE